MIIIAGYMLTDTPDARDAAVQACAEMAGRARAQDGCLDLSITADTVDATRVNVFELWRDRAALDAWREVANPPAMAPREANVYLYQTEKAEPPF